MSWGLGVIVTSIIIIVQAVALLYLYNIYNYLNQLKEDGECDKLNNPLLTIYRNIIVVYTIFILVVTILILVVSILLYSSVIVKMNDNKLISFIFRHRHILLLFNLLLGLTVLYLLYNISLQEGCKDIQPNFRIFLFIMNIIKIIRIIYSLFLKNKSNKKPNIRYYTAIYKLTIISNILMF